MTPGAEIEPEPHWWRQVLSPLGQPCHLKSREPTNSTLIIMMPSVEMNKAGWKEACGFLGFYNQTREVDHSPNNTNPCPL